MSVNASKSFIAGSSNIPAFTPPKAGKRKYGSVVTDMLDRRLASVQGTHAVALHHLGQQKGQAEFAGQVNDIAARTPMGKKFIHSTVYGHHEGEGTMAPSNSLNPNQFKDPGAHLPAGRGVVYGGNEPGAPFPAAPGNLRTNNGKPAPRNVQDGTKSFAGQFLDAHYGDSKNFSRMSQRPSDGQKPITLANGATVAPGFYDRKAGPQTAPRTFTASKYGTSKSGSKYTFGPSSNHPLNANLDGNGPQGATQMNRHQWPAETEGAHLPARPTPAQKGAITKAKRKAAAAKATPRGKK